VFFAIFVFDFFTFAGLKMNELFCRNLLVALHLWVVMLGEFASNADSHALLFFSALSSLINPRFGCGTTGSHSNG
jgi:hypothetical protein